MLTVSDATSLHHAAYDLPKLSLRHYAGEPGAWSTAYVGGDKVIPEFSTKWGPRQDRTSSRVISAAILSHLLAIFGLAYLCMKLHNRTLGAGAFHRKLSETLGEKETPIEDHQQTLAADCLDISRQTLTTSPGVRVSDGELAARAAKRARVETIVQRLTHKVERAPQVFVSGKTPAHLAFALADDRRTQNLPNFVAAQLGDGLPASILRSISAGGVTQSSQEGSMTAAATQFADGASWLNTSPGLNHEWPNDEDECVGHKGRETDLTSQAGTQSADDSGEVAETNDDQPWALEHPFIRLPVVPPDVMYAKPRLGQQDLNTLVDAVETLVFMLLRMDLTATSWWKDFTESHETDIILPAATQGAQIARPALGFNVKLVNRLSVALATLKQGKLPPPKEVLELKLMIFCHKHSPKVFREALGSPWREADAQYRTRHAGPSHGSSAKNSGDA
ncbi:hypothetical protein Efla_007212 [Eimeria flavescens]